MLRKPTKSGWLAGKPKTVVEIKSSKVECISFHAKQPLILASLESGEIELWNYRWWSLIYRFQHRHVGPVRSVNFHKKAALFVSGGDDSKVCVWDCKTFRHSFTLVGHSKPIRSVEFHHDGLPLIISASVDKTIRIWNFQSRTLVSVLNGHTGYVMSASFHPARDLIVSASLDRTVRVWGFEKICGPEGLGLSVEVKHVLQGHTAGVNSASFHPTELLVVSGGNDCTVKLWDISSAKDVAVTTLNGHKSYVSAAVFYSKGPVKRHVIVSVSQDKSIILWNGLERKILQNFTCTDDRFWCLAVHPETKLLAAGHNSGVFVFKLQRERPAFAVSGNTLVYAQDQGLHQGLYRLNLSLDSPAPATGLAFGAVKSIGSWNPLTSLCYCPEAEAVVACSDRGGGSYELVDTQRDDSLFRWENYHEKGNPDSKFCACLVTKERCAVLEIGTKRLHLKTLKGILLRTFLLPYMADAISYAGVNNVLCRSESKMFIYDLVGRMLLCELETPWVVEYVVWSGDMERVALLSKDSIVIASKKLILQRTLNETKRVKSGAWDDENGVFIYTTLDHIKFWLPNGMSGIIKSLDVPVYVTKIFGNIVFCLDRDVKISIIEIVPARYFLDLSLMDDRMTRNDLKDQLYNTNIMVVHGEGDGPGTMDISGTWCLLYFGYSSSPVGPERLQTMHAAVERISEVIIPFFVTVDPCRDTPLRLRAHLGNLASVQGVTGDGSREVAQAFGVNFERVEGEGNDYFIETPHKMYLVNPKVEIVRCFGINTDSDELSQEIAKELAFARMVSL